MNTLFPDAVSGKPTPKSKLKPRHQLAKQSFAPDKSKNQTPGFRTAQEAADRFGLREYGRSADFFWEYQNLRGNTVFSVYRWDTVDGQASKDIRPVSKWKDGLWRLGLPKGQLRPLYKLPSLENAQIVVVCEGEKAADAAIELGFTATTSIGGSQAASKTDWSPLTEKEVWFLPDNDEPGQKYVNQGATILKGLDSETPVKILMLPYLPPKGDLADWRRWPLSNGWKKTGITNIAAKTDLFQLPTATDENGSGCLPVPLEVFPQSITEYIKATAAAGTGDEASIIAHTVPAMAAAGVHGSACPDSPGNTFPPIPPAASSSRSLAHTTAGGYPNHRWASIHSTARTMSPPWSRSTAWQSRTGRSVSRRRAITN
ncbi:MAG: hypothetical protein R3B84_01320 [Zavarzinella sp.]